MNGFVKRFYCLGLILFLSNLLFGQTPYPNPPESVVKTMTYDPNNRLYYQVSNDDKYLYISIYKHENSKKLLMPGGVQYYFSVQGERDTTKLSRLTFPAYSDKNEWIGRTLVHVDRFADIRSRYLSSPNELDIRTSVEHNRLVENNPYRSQLIVPLSMIKPVGNSIDICIVLRGIRTKPLEEGTVAPVIVSKPPFKGITKEKMDEMVDLDTWTENWITYVLQ